MALMNFAIHYTYGPYVGRTDIAADSEPEAVRLLWHQLESKAGHLPACVRTYKILNSPTGKLAES